MTEINQDTPQYGTLMVNLNDTSDHLYGVGSKKYRIYAASTGANPIVKVQPWIGLPSDLKSVRSAIIENLIIDGQNLGVTGIKLQNVYNSWIRNVTIKNCDVGVHVDLKYGAWSEFNRLEHIKMINVNQGILFTTDGYGSPGYPGDSAGFTAIDDVGISLANNASAVGIQIGNTNDTNATKIKPYSSHIKANVWMDSAGGTGLKIMNGELQYGLVNLAVQGPSNGYGIDITNSSAVIANNQRFKKSNGEFTKGVFLACAGISQDNRVHNPAGVDTTDIEIKGWT